MVSRPDLRVEQVMFDPNCSLCLRPPSREEGTQTKKMTDGFQAQRDSYA